MNFRTQIESRDVSIYDLDQKFERLKGLKNGDDYEIEPCPFFVLWNFEIVSRDWGVEDLSWYATGIEGQFEIVYFDDKGDEKSRETIDFDFSLFETETELEMDHGSISPSNLEINYSDMTAIVT